MQHCYIGSTWLQLCMRSPKHAGDSHPTNASLMLAMLGIMHSRAKSHPLQMQKFSVIGSVNNQSALYTLVSLYLYIYFI